MRSFGEPVRRFTEDKLRMLRAVRLSAKLGMKLEAATAAPLSGITELLSNVPQARVLDDILKLVLAGHAPARGERVSGWRLPRRAQLMRQHQREDDGREEEADRGAPHGGIRAPVRRSRWRWCRRSRMSSTARTRLRHRARGWGRSPDRIPGPASPD